VYCNPQCQEQDWNEAHKSECKLMRFFHGQSSGSMETEILKGALRLYAIIQNHPPRKIREEEAYDGQLRSFDKLWSHVQELHLHQELKELVEGLAAHIQGEKDTDTVQLSHILLELCGVWNTNSISIPDEKKTEAIGSGLYIRASCFHHSCKPSAIFHFVGEMQEVEVRAIGDIKGVDENGKPSIPHVNYLSGESYLDVRGRMERLRGYKFKCECEICQAERKQAAVVEDFEEEDPESIRFAQIKSTVDILHRLLQDKKSKKESDSAGAGSEVKIPVATAWEEHFALGDSLLTKLRKVFNPYDERILRNLLTLFELCAILHALSSVLTKLAQDSKHHIENSVGKESSYMKEFKLILSQYPNSAVLMESGGK